MIGVEVKNNGEVFSRRYWAEVIEEGVENGTEVVHFTKEFDTKFEAEIEGLNFVRRTFGLTLGEFLAVA